MEFKTLVYVYIFGLFIFSVSIGILAAPVADVRSSSGPTLSTTDRSPTSALHLRRFNGSLDSRSRPPNNMKDFIKDYITNDYSDNDFHLPKDGKLDLIKLDEKTHKVGTLGNPLTGASAYGRAYKMKRRGKKDNEVHLVAKWFKRVDDGIKEIKTKRLVIEWGIQADKRKRKTLYSLWVITTTNIDIDTLDMQSYINYFIKTVDIEGFIPALRSQIVLQRPHDKMWVTVGTTIGSGSFGTVYNVEQWHRGTRPDTLGIKNVVLKSFRDKDKAYIELRNLQLVDELVDWGIDVNGRAPTLWAIIKKKKGQFLENLSSYRMHVLNRNLDPAGLERCEMYMNITRSAMVKESKRYLTKPGAPVHADLHQGNVLFRDYYDLEGSSIQIELSAQFIDWGIIEKYSKDGIKPNSSDIPKFATYFKEDLKKGYKDLNGIRLTDQMKYPYYDFSNNNNCSPNTQRKVVHRGIPQQ